MPIDERERRRRRELVQAHMAAENAHDIDAILATFAPNAEGVLNGLTVHNAEELRQFHILFGMSSYPGALLDTRVVPEREHFSDGEIIIEGRLAARHAGPFLGLPPTQAPVELFYTAIYRFDESGKLASERIRMNWGPLDAQWKPGA